MDNLTVRGQEAEIRGIAPHKSIDLDMYKANRIPLDWDIVGLTGDIIMAHYVDEDESGDDLINRDGILINSSVSKSMWRVVQVDLVGPGVAPEYGVGKYLMVPNDKGLPMSKFKGKNMIFLNAERVFAVVEPKQK